MLEKWGEKENALSVMVLFIQYLQFLEEISYKENASS